MQRMSQLKVITKLPAKQNSGFLGHTAMPDLPIDELLAAERL